jgi:hypothetical protein
MSIQLRVLNGAYCSWTSDASSGIRYRMAPHAAQSLARGVRRGFPHVAHGGPNWLSR